MSQKLAIFAFVGAPWTDPTEAVAAAAPTAISTEAWAFVVSGRNWRVNPQCLTATRSSSRNLRTNSVVTTSVQRDYFAAATADLEATQRRPSRRCD